PIILFPTRNPNPLLLRTCPPECEEHGITVGQHLRARRDLTAPEAHECVRRSTTRRNSDNPTLSLGDQNGFAIPGHPERVIDLGERDGGASGDGYALQRPDRGRILCAARPIDDGATVRCK